MPKFFSMKSIARKLTDLTHREYEIYERVRKGMKSKEIACELFSVPAESLPFAGLGGIRVQQLKILMMIVSYTLPNFI